VVPSLLSKDFASISCFCNRLNPFLINCRDQCSTSSEGGQSADKQLGMNMNLQQIHLL
jgi:hypothetical protein